MIAINVRHWEQGNHGFSRWRPVAPQPFAKPSVGGRAIQAVTANFLRWSFGLAVLRQCTRSTSGRARRLASLDEVDEAIARLLKEQAVVKKSERVPVRSLRVGQRLTGIIQQIGPFGLFVDVGAQRDGLVNMVNSKTDKKVPISLVSKGYIADVYEEYMPGQKVTVFVAQIKHNGELSLTMQPSRARKSKGMLKEDLSDFKDAGEEWLTGTLVHASERGFFVEVRRPGPEQGRTTGFVPISESVLRPEELQVGAELKVRMLQPTWRSDHKLYLSMRSARSGETTHLPSPVKPVKPDLDAFLQLPKATWLRGVVKRTTSSGAFLSLRHPYSAKHATAFVHISLMAVEKIEDPAQVVEIGEEVSVRLLELNATTGDRKSVV